MGTLARNDYLVQRELAIAAEEVDSRRAIFWFKSTAEENIRKVWELVYMLREHGHHVEVQKCRRLGNIVWEDDFQAAAFPSDSDGRISIQ
jgi:hypothetical protein